MNFCITSLVPEPPDNSDERNETMMEIVFGVEQPTIKQKCNTEVDMLTDDFVKSLIRNRIIEIMNANKPAIDMANIMQVIAASAVSLSVTIEHPAHHVRYVVVIDQATGDVLARSAALTDGSALTALNKVNEWRKMLKVEGYERQEE